jgi:hypothetical protein
MRDGGARKKQQTGLILWMNGTDKEDGLFELQGLGCEAIPENID